MDAIKLLKAQHKKTKAALEKAAHAKLTTAESKKAATELVAHMIIEEHVFYPRVRELVADMVAESFEEHAVARFELARCLAARGRDQTKARFTVLKELIEHHVDEEEEEMFPKVEAAISADELARLGEQMQQMFELAVERGLDALVTRTTYDLRAPNGSKRVSVNGVKRPVKRATKNGRRTNKTQALRRAA